VKVCILSRDFPPDHGGVQTWMERIALYYGEHAIVIARHCPGDADYDARQSYEIKRMPRLEWKPRHPALNMILRALSSFLRFVISGVMLSDAIRAQKTDIVHCAYVFANGLPMMVVRILTGCPYVVYCHGTEILREKERGGVRRLIMRLVLRLAARVIVNSRFMRDEVGELIPVERIIIAPLGADSGKLDPQRIPVEEIDGRDLKNRTVLVTVGRLEPRKGHDMIVRALSTIAAREPRVLWIVVGEGPERPSIESLVAQNNLTERVIFAGRRGDDELSGILARADLFVMPSRRIGPDVEGFGIVFLEAALFGVPAVAGRSGGMADAVEDGVTGLLCEPENPQELADKILQIISSPELRRSMGDQARARAQARTWSACCAHVDAQLQTLVL